MNSNYAPALQKSSEPGWLSVILAPERAGRWIMDFGFGSLVDKFEERIGHRPTSALLWLAAIALFVTCVRAIILGGVIPTIDFVRGIGGATWLDLATKILISAVIAICGAILLALVFRSIVRRPFLKLIEKTTQLALDTQQNAARIERQVTLLEDEIMRFEAETGKKFGSTGLREKILAARMEREGE